MKIRRISAYRVELPLREGSYRWSGGKAVTVFDSTVVRVENGRDEVRVAYKRDGRIHGVRGLSIDPGGTAAASRGIERRLCRQTQRRG